MKNIVIIISIFPLLESCFLGGGGCGCGCLPRLPPPEFTCVSVPVLKLSLPTCTTPCCPPGPSFSPCGKRKKRKISLYERDFDCTDSLLRQIILQNLKNNTMLSVHFISMALKEFYGYNNTFGVNCGSRKDFFYSTTMNNYCFEGNDKILCGVFKYN
uniref:Ground-like domain-containing protein n=1 Tax=Strongyloides papillosus TaxID=174720 RepID=A0A0N5BVJ6_STREA